MKETEKHSKPEDTKIISKLACSIDDICNAKKGGRLLRHKTINKFVATLLSGDRDRFEEFTLVLEKDKQLPKMKRIFPDFNVTAQKLFTWPEKVNGLGRLFQKITLFSDWQKKSEFLDDLESLGLLLEYGHVIASAVRLINSKTYPNKVVDNNRIGLIYLRELTSVFYTAATMKMLPTVSNTNELSRADKEEVVSAIKRFSVEEEVLSQYKNLQLDLKTMHADITDFLVDYPKSAIRIKGLASLAKNCRAYTSPKD